MGSNKKKRTSLSLGLASEKKSYEQIARKTFHFQWAVLFVFKSRYINDVNNWKWSRTFKQSGSAQDDLIHLCIPTKKRCKMTTQLASKYKCWWDITLTCKNHVKNYPIRHSLWHSCHIIKLNCMRKSWSKNYNHSIMYSWRWKKGHNAW